MAEEDSFEHNIEAIDRPSLSLNQSGSNEVCY
jgi:hypothetical protein